MSVLSLQNYFNHASSILGRDALSISGMMILFVATVISTQMIYMVANSLSGGHAEYFRSLVLCILTVMLAPLAMIGLEIGLGYADVNLLRSWLVLLSLVLPGVLVTSFLTARSFRCNIFSGVLSILPAMCFWFLLIILLNQVEETLVSGREKADSIKDRTEDLDQWLK